MCPIVELTHISTSTPCAFIRSANAFCFAKSRTSSEPILSPANVAMIMPSENAPGYAARAASIFSGSTAQMRWIVRNGAAVAVPAAKDARSAKKNISIFISLFPSST